MFVEMVYRMLSVCVCAWLTGNSGSHLFLLLLLMIRASWLLMMRNDARIHQLYIISNSQLTWANSQRLVSLRLNNAGPVVKVTNSSISLLSIYRHPGISVKWRGSGRGGRSYKASSWKRPSAGIAAHSVKGSSPANPLIITHVAYYHPGTTLTRHAPIGNPLVSRIYRKYPFIGRTYR